MGKRSFKRAVQRVGGLTVNKLVVFIVRRGLSVPPVTPHSVLAIVAPGRRTGRRRATPIGFVRTGKNTLLVVSEHGSRSDWFQNANAAGRVEVWLGGRRHAASVRLLPDEDPLRVLKQMQSSVVALSNRLLWHEPKVIEIAIEDEPGKD